MANISESCISAAKEALSKFDKVDLEQYVVKVFNRAKEFPELRGAAGTERAIQEINNEQAQFYLENMQVKIVDKAKIAEQSAAIEKKDVRLLDVLARRLKNYSNNVESSGNAARKKLMDASINRFTAEQTKYLSDVRNSVDIMRAVDGKEASSIGKEIGKILVEYGDKRNSEEVNSGSLLLSNINKDRFLRAIHDVGKILNGGRNLVEAALSKKYTVDAAKDLWRNFIKGHLNLEKTFADSEVMNLDGSVDMAKADSVLNEIFNNITVGKPLLIGKGSGKQEMFFYWKDNEAWMRYNEKYGKGNLLNALRADIQASSNKVGMANILGSNPTAAYNHLAELEIKTNPQSIQTRTITKAAFDVLSGNDRNPVNPRIASFFAALRGLSGGAKLIGRMTVLSLPDIANGITFAHRYGHDYFGAYGTYLSGLFNAIPSEERKYIAGLFKEMTDTHLGYMSRYIESNNAGDVINKFNNFLYKWTAMDALDRGNKISALQLMARILGDNSEFEHAALNDTAKGMLDKFNISDKEWNVLRTKVKTLNGKKLLAIDSVEDLTNSDLKQMYGNSDKSLYQMKNDLHRKVYSMFDVASENSVLTPGTFMKASSKLSGAGSGNLIGEILGSVMQFKMYPMEFIDRVLYQGYKGADGVQNKLKFGAALFGATLPMSFLSMYMDNMFRGKTMPDWNKMTVGEKVNYSKDLLFPGLGLFGSILNPEDQSPGKVGSYFSTPALQLLYGTAASLISIPENLIENSPKSRKNVKKSFEAFAKSVLPGQGLPFVQPYMRQMFGDKPYLQPGQKQIIGK